MKDKPLEKCSTAEYIAWVQRSLNREVGSNLKDDGSIVPPYRKLVAELNARYLFRLNFEQVDEATQDMLIQLNNAREDYVRWVQRSLQRAGASDSTLSGVLDQPTRAGILAFQRYRNLNDDGWVGPDTESALIRVAGKGDIPGRRVATKPKPVPKPKPPSDPRSPKQKAQDWVHIFRDEANADPKRDAQQKLRMTCVCNKLKFNDETWRKDRYITPTAFQRYLREPISHRTFREAIEGHTVRLKSQLMLVALQHGTYEKFAEKFEEFYLDVERGLALIRQYHNGKTRDAQFWVYSDRLVAIHLWAKETQQDRHDIYSCFNDE